MNSEDMKIFATTYNFIRTLESISEKELDAIIYFEKKGILRKEYIDEIELKKIGVAIQNLDDDLIYEYNKNSYTIAYGDLGKGELKFDKTTFVKLILADNMKLVHRNQKIHGKPVLEIHDEMHKIYDFE
jgi:hypothetical protein